MSTENKVSQEDQIAALTAQVQEIVKAKGAFTNATTTPSPDTGGLDGVIHLDSMLTDFGIKYMQEDSAFKAKDICSVLNSKHQSDRYYFYEPAYFMISQMAARAEGQEAARARYGVKRKGFNIEVYALKTEITAETLANADGSIGDARKDTTAFLIRQAMLHREKACFTALMGTGIWSSNATAVAANGDTDSVSPALDTAIVSSEFTSFSDPDSKPLQILDSAFTTVHKRSGLRPNTVVMNRNVFDAIKRNQSIMEANQYVAANTGTESAVVALIAAHLAIPVASIFILDVVEVTAALEADSTDGAGNAGNTTVGRKVEAAGTWGTYEIKTNAEGEAIFENNAVAPTDYVGLDGVLVMHINKASSGQFEATAAVCTQWTGLYPDAGALGNVMIRRYDAAELQAESVEINTAFGYEICAPALGMYLHNAIV